MQSLVVLRGLMGVGLGGAPVAFALFLELVPSSKRGVLMVALQSFWTIGSMLEVRTRPHQNPWRRVDVNCIDIYLLVVLIHCQEQDRP